MTILYRTHATAIGGRSGSAASDDGRLRVDLSTPKAIGGDDGSATNPEQLFAAGYAACFLSAIKQVARRDGIRIANDSNVTAGVSLRPNDADEGLTLAVTLSIDLPGLDAATADDVVHHAHAICPYSNAVRGNIDVKLRVG